MNIPHRDQPLPNHADLEPQVIGAVLMDPSCYHDLAAILGDGSCFYLPEYQHAWKVIAELAQGNNAPVVDASILEGHGVGRVVTTTL